MISREWATADIKARVEAIKAGAAAAIAATDDQLVNVRFRIDPHIYGLPDVLTASQVYWEEAP